MAYIDLEYKYIVAFTEHGSKLLKKYSHDELFGKGICAIYDEVYGNGYINLHPKVKKNKNNPNHKAFYKNMEIDIIHNYLTELQEFLENSLDEYNNPGYIIFKSIKDPLSFTDELKKLKFCKINKLVKMRYMTDPIDSLLLYYETMP